MTFAQGQLILNAYYAVDFYPFVCTAKPASILAEPEREGMPERIRSAKAALISKDAPVSRETFRKVADSQLPFIPTVPEVEDMVVILEGVLTEGKLDPRNVAPLVGAGVEGAPLDELASLIQQLRNAG